MKKICSIYKSPKKEGMYLYVEKSQGLKDVPAALLERFGTPTLAMTLLIDENRELARVEASKVLEQITANGFYLQMPPVEDADSDPYMTEINLKNSKLGR